MFTARNREQIEKEEDPDGTDNMVCGIVDLIFNKVESLPISGAEVMCMLTSISSSILLNALNKTNFSSEKKRQIVDECSQAIKATLIRDAHELDS